MIRGVGAWVGAVRARSVDLPYGHHGLRLWETSLLGTLGGLKFQSRWMRWPRSRGEKTMELALREDFQRPADSKF